MTSRKFLILFFFTVIFLILTVDDAYAVFRQRLRPAASQRDTRTTTAGVSIIPRLRADRRALLVNFANLHRAAEVSYYLTYSVDGKPEGLQGSIQPTKAQDSRQLLFGTCSGGVCTYHTNIKNMRFVVTSRLKNGATHIRPYRIRP